MLNGGYMVTVTVENLGGAGAEVPVTVRFDGGEVTKRLEVRGKNKGVIRMEVPAAPREVVVNDSSVPESDTTNDTLKIQPADSKLLSFLVLRARLRAARIRVVRI